MSQLFTREILAISCKRSIHKFEMNWRNPTIKQRSSFVILPMAYISVRH